MRTVYIILLAMSGAVIVTAGPVLSQGQQSAASERAAKPPQTATASAATAPAAATTGPSGGMLRTLPHGEYECALPGDAGGRAFEVLPSEGFRISTASRYTDEDGAGTYILRGDRLTFTAGPKNGERFDRIGENQLRKTDAQGNLSELFCTRLADRRQ